MPFIGAVEGSGQSWKQIFTVDLRQLPETKPRETKVRVLSEFGYTAKPPEGSDGQIPTWTTEAIDYLIVKDTETDLASVPSFLWGVVASYGRQSLPAILHDVRCLAAEQPVLPRAFQRRDRRDADNLFLTTLRDAGAGRIRSRLMWAAVRLGGQPTIFAWLAVVLLLVLAAILISPWRPYLWLGTGVAAAVLIALMFASSRESQRNPQPFGSRLEEWQEYTLPAFVPRAFESLATATLIGAGAAVLLIPVTIITVATDAVIRIGEKPLPVGVLPSAADGIIDKGVVARITWSPLAPLVGSLGLPPDGGHQRRAPWWGAS